MFFWGIVKKYKIDLKSKKIFLIFFFISWNWKKSWVIYSFDMLIKFILLVN